MVIFAYEFGGSRNHPRARQVARVMRENGIGTLLCDLLTDEEEFEDEATGIYRTNADLLAARLVAVTRWVSGQAELKHLRLAYFGACTGGGAALIAAGKLRKKVRAVVSREGRTDLAARWLPRVACPTLLIAGERDEANVALSRSALERLTCEKELQLVPGASHLFGEPGALEAMARRSARWLQERLGNSAEPWS